MTLSADIANARDALAGYVRCRGILTHRTGGDRAMSRRRRFGDDWLDVRPALVRVPTVGQHSIAAQLVSSFSSSKIARVGIQIFINPALPISF